MHDCFVQTRHGRLHWLDSQSADDTQHPQSADLPPLILLHSAGGSAYEWQLVWTALSAQRRVLALDLPGHGDSDPLSRHYGIADYAAAVAEWIASIGLLHDEHDGHDGKKPVLAGSSVGGSTTLCMAGKHAECVSRVVLVETPILSSETWRRNWWHTEQMFGFTTQTMEENRSRFRNLSPEMLLRRNIDRNKAGVKTMMGTLWAIREFDALTAITRMQVPALAIVGVRGPIQDGVRLLEQYAGGQQRIAVMPDCGHFPHIDDPELFVREMLRLLALQD